MWNSQTAEPYIFPHTRDPLRGFVVVMLPSGSYAWCRTFAPLPGTYLTNGECARESHVVYPIMAWFVLIVCWLTPASVWSRVGRLQRWKYGANPTCLRTVVLRCPTSKPLSVNHRSIDEQRIYPWSWFVGIGIPEYLSADPRGQRSHYTSDAYIGHICTLPNMICRHVR